MKETIAILIIILSSLFIAFSLWIESQYPTTQICIKQPNEGYIVDDANQRVDYNAWDQVCSRLIKKWVRQIYITK